MLTFLTLLNREIRAFFLSPVAWVVLFFFLLLTGFNFYAGVAALNRGPSEVTVVEAFFNTVFSGSVSSSSCRSSPCAFFPRNTKWARSNRS